MPPRGKATTAAAVPRSWLSVRPVQVGRGHPLGVRHGQPVRELLVELRPPSLRQASVRGVDDQRVHEAPPPRRLVFMHLDGSVDRLPAHGAPLTLADGTQVGFTGSSASARNRLLTVRL